MRASAIRLPADVWRRGYDWLRGKAANLMELLTVADAMAPMPAPLAPEVPLDTNAAILARAVPTLHPDQSLEQALGQLVDQDRSGLPVTSTDGRSRILGWLTHRDVLAAYNSRLQHSVAQAQTSPGTRVPGSVTRLPGYRVVDLELINDAPPVGQRVAQVTWPPATLLIAIRRHDTSLTPTDDTQLEQGDRLTLLVPTEHADLITEHLQHRAPPAADSSA